MTSKRTTQKNGTVSFTRKDGATVKRRSDGTTVVKKTNKKGKAVTKVKRADGSKSVTRTSKNGNRSTTTHYNKKNKVQRIKKTQGSVTGKYSRKSQKVSDVRARRAAKKG